MPKEIIEIFNLAKNLNQADKDLILQAYNYAAEKHQNQKRFSGEPYIIHPLAVAKILAETQADPKTIAAGLLHDTVEDTEANIEEIEGKFGQDIAFLVEGVTKLGHLKYQGLERHVESLRKMFLATASDIRVIVIRLADRLHNVRTLKYVRPDKQKRIALETIEIYAPMANRLGMWRMKGLLEDSSFPYLNPKAFREVVELRKAKGKETIKHLKNIARTLQKELAKVGLRDIQVDYRIKYLYSLYLKLKRKDMDIDSIHDISALRIVVPELADCYQTLGIIHSLWRPIPGRLKDYIATPKPNGYQSIHTTVFTGEGTMAEIQIRTQTMHYEAQYGIASHLLYDETGKLENTTHISKKTKWLSNFIERQTEETETEEFLTNLKQDLFSHSIFVFTPKGDVIELPEGSTPIDFAYTIHSDIGNQAVGAMVNNKLVSLSTPLKDNDIVSIETKKRTEPNIKWLDFVKTTQAKRHIRSRLLRDRKKT